MRVRNLHARTLNATTTEVGSLLDSLAGTEDRLWPIHNWPAMKFDGPLAVGAVGGHGPIRYTIVGYTPGTWIRFQFSGPRGFDGYHEFRVEPTQTGATKLCHRLAITARGPAMLTWPVAFRWMHDALLEDCLDRAEYQLTAALRGPARWTTYVRLLRKGFTLLNPRPAPDYTSSSAI